MDGAVKPKAALSIEERLRRAGRPFGLGDFLDEQVQGGRGQA